MKEETDLKIVARLRDGKLVKGFVKGSSPATLEAFLRESWQSPASVIGVHTLELSERISVPLHALKALFFVKTFDGRKEYREVKFFERTPPMNGLWVRVEFHDHETLEGIVENSLRHLTEPGFFMKPPDPQGNNESVYVMKDFLQTFRILGVKPDY